jgi:uroporphyrinogen decarboxylase
MTSRERVLCTLSLREPDRVAIDLAGHRASGIAAIAYARLRRALALPVKPIRVFDPIQQLAIVDDDVLDLFQVDTIALTRGYALEERWWADWVLADGTPCKIPAWAVPERYQEGWVLKSESGRILGRMPDGAMYFDQVYAPLAENDGPGQLADAMRESLWTAIAVPPGPSAPGVEELREGARRLRAGSDRCIVAVYGGNLIELGQFLYGMENFLTMLAGEPQRAHRFLDQATEMHLAYLDRFLGAVGPYIDVMRFGDDLGGQNGPLISPAMYREFFKPRHKLLWDRARQLADVKVVLHSCGAIRALLPDLIDAGLDGINPVQISARGMDAAGLKRDFGRQIAFWGGGCDTQQVLPWGTPEGVRRHVREQIRVLAPGGGFIFTQVHNIQANVPPENVIALLEAASANGHQ